MIVSNSKKFIYIHVPKTGGTSISEILRNYSTPIGRNTKWAGRIRRYLGQNTANKLLLFDKHTPLKEAKQVLSFDKFNSFFKFGFMRNPFDFIVSSYFYQKSDSANINYQLVNSFKDFPEFIRNMSHSSSYQ